jgi:hypothetical protein
LKKSALGSARIQRPSRTGQLDVVHSKQEALPVGLERVRPILNGDGTVKFSDRVHAVRAIQTKLTEQEVEAFYRYLLAPTPQSGQDLIGENWLRNEIMDKLVEQPAPPRGLSDVLIAVYQDTTQDAVTRDYAVQHMAPSYERANAEEQARLQAALWQATTETATSIGGTAMLALMDVAQVDSSLDRNRLAQIALESAANDRCGELARITAVQVCGRMAVQQALPVVEQLTQEAQNMPLRIAATAALGNYGTPEASNLLARVAASADPRQALAAQSALRRFASGQVALAGQTGPRATR